MSDLLGRGEAPENGHVEKGAPGALRKEKGPLCEYRKAQADMRQAVAVKANIDHLLGHTDERENKAQER